MIVGGSPEHDRVPDSRREAPAPSGPSPPPYAPTYSFSTYAEVKSASVAE